MTRTFSDRLEDAVIALLLRAGILIAMIFVLLVVAMEAMR
jgi:hypothetical protein